MIRFIDLFAGLGGNRLGLESVSTNCRCVFSSEWDEPACKTYEANFGEHPAGDITQIDENDIPAFDICLASTPCQAFSKAGSRLGFEDNYHGRCRGTLFLDVVRICDHHRPRVIFMENVKGLTTHNHGETFKIICETFNEIGYTVFSKVLNSKDFGVPQNRERIYIVCFRNDIAPSHFEFPVGDPSNGATIRSILEDAPIPPKYYVSDVYMDYCHRKKERNERKGNGFGYTIRDLDGISGTLVCGGMGHEQNLIIDNRPHSMIPTTHIKGSINTEGVRKMTPREWARLQGFPDSYKLPLSDIHHYKQFGNTVTVPVISAIMREIVDTHIFDDIL